MKISLTGLYSFGLALMATSANAQITPDGSLPTDVQQSGSTIEITGGSQAGNNLFHSFQDFSVPTNNTAFFNNGMDIDNILSRVTGGNISNIDGLIRANGDANLFLINPAGIIFGENARLDVGGSFLGSTATGLLFDDGSEFSGINSDAPVLSINAPIGLNLRNTTGNISSQGNLNSDNDLTLAANNLSLQGQLTAGNNLTIEALNNITVRDRTDNPFIATAGNELSLQGGNIDLFALNNSDSGLFSGGDLILRSDNPINSDAHYYSGGNFKVERLDNSFGSLISLQDPIVRSQGDVSFADYTGASLHILAGGSVTVEGDINITGVDTTANSLQETITLSNGSQVNIDGNAQPTLDIRAGINNLDLTEVVGDGITPNSTNTPTGSNININGTVNNSGGTVFLTNQYQANSELAGGDIRAIAINTSNNSGNGGNVTIDSHNNISIPNGIDTSSIVNSQLVTVATDSIADSNIASGDGGRITLFAVEDIVTGNFNTASRINLNLITEVDTIEEANIISIVPFTNLQVGKGGNVNLQSDNNISTGKINSSSSLVIDSNSVALDNFSIVSAILEFNLADGGNINLNAGNNIATQDINSNVFVSDRFTSRAETTPNITLSVSEITLTIPQGNTGSGGNIFLQAGNEVNTDSLNSSVALISDVDNSTDILANDPEVATIDRPSRAFSTVDILYENINIGQGGSINIASDRANVGDVNTSIGITSDSMAFAEATAQNNAAVNSFANNKVSLNGVGDRPGSIIFDVDGGVRVDNLNSDATINATNNLDSQATSEGGENSFANASTNDRFGNESINQITFDSEINFALIRFNLNNPDVDYVVGETPEISINKIQPGDFNTCPVNADKLNRQPQAIETAQGKIYPARGVVIENGQILLTAKPNKNSVSRSSIRLESCL